MPEVSFYFDLGSPYAYLAAERLHTVLPEPIAWKPVLVGGLFKLSGRSSWARGDEERRQAGIAEIERRARSYGLPPIDWPELWPSDYLLAMRAATYAFTVARGREFCMQAFRNAFQGGRELIVPEQVFEAGERVGVDRGELEAATQDPRVKDALRSATQAAFELGVTGVPTIAIDDQLFWGDDRLQEAAAHLERVAARR
jgi:2-hydroxychromene-2-carboxylate isomerase